MKPAVKDSANQGPLEDLTTLLRLAQPTVVYTHNLADKHETHVAVAVLRQGGGQRGGSSKHSNDEFSKEKLEKMKSFVKGEAAKNMPGKLPGAPGQGGQK